MRRSRLALMLAVWLCPAAAHAQEAMGSNEERAAPPTPAPAPHRTTWGLRLDAGYALRKLTDLPVRGADLGLGLGVQPWRYAAIVIATRTMFGATEYGLDVRTFKLGPELELVLDRMRFGLGLHVFGIGIDRALRDDTISTMGYDASLAVRADVFDLDTVRLFVRGALDAGEAEGLGWWGGTLGAGVDFSLSGASADN